LNTPLDQQNQISSTGQDTVREQDKIQLVLAYMPCLLSLIPFLTVKDSDFVKWHAKQGLVLTIGGGIILIVLSIIPFVNFATCLLGPGMLVLMVMGIMKSLKGERWRIPGAADLADKF
jgi:fumarate reductase subunit D